MAGKRTTLTLTGESEVALNSIHEALAAAGKVRTYSDTVNWLLLREARNVEQLAPAKVSYRVIDQKALDELKAAIVEETRTSALFLIQETIRGEIAQGFRSMLESLKK